MPDKEDHLTTIPSITPARDEVASYHRNRRPGQQPTGRREPETTKTAAKVRRGSPLFSVILILLLSGVGAWAYVLQQQTVVLERRASDSEARLAELEGRLSSTDENVSQSSVAMQVKLNELDAEVRKLWDNVWKRSKDQLAAHESKLTRLESDASNQSKQLGKMEADQNQIQQQITEVQKQAKEVQGLSAQIASFKTQNDSRQRLLTELQKQLADLESQASRLGSRLKEIEGWNESNIAYRKQVTGRLAEIEKEINTLKVVLNPY